jgi:hypothetical protein
MSFTTSSTNSPFQPGPSGFNPINLPSKYIRLDGVIKINPAYIEYSRKCGNDEIPTTSALNPDKALNVVSSIDQYNELNNILNTSGQNPLSLSETTKSTQEIMRMPENYQNIGITEDSIMIEIGKIFAKHEAPIGLMNKLLILSEYNELQFIIDDSGSMGSISDTKDSFGRLQSRWEEAHNRLKEMIEILAYVPTPRIVICFLNRHDVITLRHQGEDPKLFIENSYRLIDSAFRNNPNGSTPVRKCLQQSFHIGTNRKIARYLFCDGEPDGGESAKEAITEMIKNRPNPQDNPLTFLSCTSNDDEVEWMKEAEEIAPFCAEYDDFKSEAKEVQYDQGDALPFTKGFYLIGQLVGAMNPHDLDAMDESVPLTKWSLDNLLGVVLSNQEYQHYFDGFKEAQRKRSRLTRMDILKSQYPWEMYYTEFLQQRTATDLQGVRRFRACLKSSIG